MGLGKNDIHFFMGTFRSIEMHKPNNASGYTINIEPTLNDGFAPNSDYIHMAQSWEEEPPSSL
jgi:hypothetical protein